jgi:hypothetical protein
MKIPAVTRPADEKKILTLVFTGEIHLFSGVKSN